MLRFLILFALVWLALRVVERGLRLLAAATTPPSHQPRHGSAGPRSAGPRSAGPRSAGPRSATVLPRQQLVVCARCGARFPASGKARDGEPVYCCEACRLGHRSHGSSDDGGKGWTATP